MPTGAESDLGIRPKRVPGGECAEWKRHWTNVLAEHYAKRTQPSQSPRFVNRSPQLVVYLGAAGHRKASARRRSSRDRIAASQPRRNGANMTSQLVEKSPVHHPTSDSPVRSANHPTAPPVTTPGKPVDGDGNKAG